MIRKQETPDCQPRNEMKWLSGKGRVDYYHGGGHVLARLTNRWSTIF